MTTVRRAGADSEEKSIRKDPKRAEISREALALLLQPFNNQDHGGNNPRINVSYDSQVVKMLIFKFGNLNGYQMDFLKDRGTNLSSRVRA